MQHFYSRSQVKALWALVSLYSFINQFLWLLALTAFYIVLVFDDPLLYPHNLNAILFLAECVKIMVLVCTPMAERSLCVGLKISKRICEIHKAKLVSRYKLSCFMLLSLLSLQVMSSLPSVVEKIVHRAGCFFRLSDVSVQYFISIFIF